MLDVSEKLNALSQEQKQALIEKLKHQFAPEKNIDQHFSELSHAQRRLWLIQQLTDCAYLYHIPLVLKFSKPIHQPSLESAFNLLVKENPILGSRLKIDHETVHQTFNSNLSIQWVLILLEDELPPSIDLQSHNELSSFFLDSFDFEQGPLFRVGLAKGPKYDYLMLCFHHFIMDGWSSHLLISRLSELYVNALKLGHESLTHEDDYTAFIAWENTQNSKRQQMDYWLERLNNKPFTVDLITDYSRKLKLSGHGKTLHFSVLNLEFGALQTYAKHIGITTNQLMLFAFQFTLARYSGQDEITLGIPTAGRSQPRWLKTIGLFVNTCLHTTVLHYDHTVNQQLQYLKQHLLFDLANSDIPFDELIQQLYAKKQIHQGNNFNILFNFIAADQPLTFAGNECDFHYCLLPISKFDLSLHVYASATNADLFFEFSTDLYQENTIKLIAEYMLRLLQQLPDYDQLTLRDLAS